MIMDNDGNEDIVALSSQLERVANEAARRVGAAAGMIKWDGDRRYFHIAFYRRGKRRGELLLQMTPEYLAGVNHGWLLENLIATLERIP